MLILLAVKIDSFEIFDIEEEFDDISLLEKERRQSFYILTYFYNEVDSIENDCGNMRKLRRRKDVNYVDNTEIPKDIFKGKLRKKRRSVKNVPREHISDLPVEDINKLCPGTPTYKSTFKKIKYKKRKELFLLYNSCIFNNRLPRYLCIQ